MIKFERAKKAYPTATNRYDARVGILHVGTQANGEGWWNWWVALAEQGPAAGENAIVESGGAETLVSAKRAITDACKVIERAIRKAL